MWFEIIRKILIKNANSVLKENKQKISLTYRALFSKVLQLFVLQGKSKCFMKIKPIVYENFLKRFVAVPRVFEKMHQQMESAFNEAKGPKAHLLNWATKVSLNHYNSLLAGQKGRNLRF